jgi:hypothetical protein
MSDACPESHQPGDPRLAALLAELPRLAAPRELDERVRLELSTRLPLARLLGDLQRGPAPRVLDRLVAEELAKPSAGVERLVASLPRLSAPTEVAAFPRPDRPIRSIRLAYGAFAAAALLLLGLAWRWTGSQVESDQDQLAQAPQRPQRPAPRFELRPLSAGALDPLARELFESIDQGRSQLGEGG